ncbi:MAG: ribonuclease PH [Planctomycetota bacterium]|nr:ribonuclease PH [Planctomycetota bacterium]
MTRFVRHDGRKSDDLRPVRITPGFIRSAAGSCLIEVGGTRVVCTASFTPGVPKWRTGQGLGWMTAEYGMLPASTSQRKDRPIGKPDGRSVEIQRIIGRVLRSAVRLDRLGENTIYLDCDVLEADGGTRTAAITGAWVALARAVDSLAGRGLCHREAVSPPVAAISVGMVDGRALLDLDYSEDSTAEVDMNIAMTAGGKYVEIQGSSEGRPFGGSDLEAMLSLARRGIRRLHVLQRQAVRKRIRP